MMREAVRTAMLYLPGADVGRLWLQTRINRSLHRPFEREFNALRVLRGLELCLDVGANRGQSIEALSIVAPGARIISFEPQPELACYLRARYPHVRVEACALGERDAHVTIYVPLYRGRRFDALASITREDAEAWFPYSVLRYDPDLLEIEEMSVSVRALDTFDLHPNFIKLDVQGHELDALKGGRETLRDHPVLMVETPTPDVIAFLADLGYRMYFFDGQCLVRQHEPAGLNMLFMA